MKGGDSLVPNGTRESFVRSAAALRATNPLSAEARTARTTLHPIAYLCSRKPPAGGDGTLRPARGLRPVQPTPHVRHRTAHFRPGDHPRRRRLFYARLQGIAPTRHSRLHRGRRAGRPFGIVHPDRLRCVEHPRVGRHRRHLPAFRHGTRILVPQTAERGRHGRHGRRDDRGGNDVRGVRNGHVAGFLPHEQHFPGRDALDVVDGDRLQGLRRHGAARTALHGRGAGHPRGRGSGGRRADGAALDAGREQAVRRRRDAGQHPQTGSLPDLLVAAGHLPDPHAAQTAATAAQRRNAAHRDARPVSGDGDDRRQGRFLGCTRRLRHGIAPGRNGRSRTDHTTGRTGQEPLRRDLLRLGRHDDRTGAARALRRPHRAAHGRGTRRTGDFRHARRARIGTTAARSRAVGILAHAGRRVRLHHSHPGHDATRDRRLPLSRHRGRIGRHDLPDALHDAGRRPRLRLSRTAPACQMAAVAGALRIGRRPRKPPQHLAAAAAAHDAARRTLSGLLHLRRSGLPALRRTVDRGADSGSDGRCGESGGDPRRAGADPARRAPAGQPLARIPTVVERQQIQPRAARLAHSHQMPALHRDSDDRRGVAVRHRFGHGLRRVAGAAHRHRLLETAPPPFVRNGGASARELRRRRHGRCRTAAE